MPRKAILGSVLLSGLLLAGCEWCGNCKGLCGRSNEGSYLAGPSTASSRGTYPIVSTQTPSSMAANRTTGGSGAPSGESPATTLRRSTDPNGGQAYYPNSSPSSSGIVPARGQATRPMANALPEPEPAEAEAPYEQTPRIQAPPRNLTGRPQY